MRVAPDNAVPSALPAVPAFRLVIAIIIVVVIKLMKRITKMTKLMKRITKMIKLMIRMIMMVIISRSHFIAPLLTASGATLNRWEESFV